MKKFITVNEMPQNEKFEPGNILRHKSTSNLIVIVMKGVCNNDDEFAGTPLRIPNSDNYEYQQQNYARSQFRQFKGTLTINISD